MRVARCSLRVADSFQGFVSGVQWQPESEFVFASCSYDKTVKVWDIRSKTPLFVLTGADRTTTHDDKALCVSWLKRDEKLTLLSGGSDSKLRMFSL